MPDKPRRKTRCAIYARKSSDEGLEQDFNSLDAQREACEAYIVSQKHEGWTCLPDPYDDGGISGATLERPALQRLLADIRARKVDVVVVYKVDRLTRALADFAKIVEIFDAQEVSFVSVTQQFNTTSSMGRLTLNVLLSFAQFEREVTAERIRDKIAASKKKGMWMGGTVPLGYDARDRTLVINEPEAESVRTLFRLYLDLGSVRALQVVANHQGLRSKTGRSFAYGHLYTILQNPIYIGQIRHKKVTYPGLHPPIIDRTTWDTVQTHLDGNRIRRRDGAGAKNPSPLAGRLYDDKGDPFTPSHAVKRGKRYRYYVERAAVRPSTDATGRQRPRRNFRRIAASEIEGVINSTLIRMLRTPTEAMEAVAAPTIDAAASRSVIAAASRLAKEFEDSDHAKAHNLMRRLVTRVTVRERSIGLRLSRSYLRDLFGMAVERAEADSDDVELSIAAQLRPRGGELKFVITDPDVRRTPIMDAALITAIVRAHCWLDDLMNGKAQSLREIALRENLHERYVRRILELAFLAPDITEIILDGRQPADLMLQEIVPDGALPLDWASQRKLLRLE
ncbi:MAG: recombinase family protein [Alphaproteobacteria bacterium]